MDHQMNIRLSEAFGQYFVRLPLKKSPAIHHGNALAMDWRKVIPAGECSYILSNPPFVGSRFLTDGQRHDMAATCGSVKNSGVLDYVTAWYFKAAEYIRDSRVRAGYVSTNSISQGEQPGIIWGELFRRGMKIHFAHRTFRWESEARGKAHVHVVIVGFAAYDTDKKTIYDYEGLDGNHAGVSVVRNINPYLVAGADTVLPNRKTPLCDVPAMGIGNQPIDGGFYLFTDKEKRDFVREEPLSKPLFRPWVGSEEFINRGRRWCLWLGDCTPGELKSMPLVLGRIKSVKQYRLASKRASTVKLAATPTRFLVERMPKGSFLVVPEVSSERRDYIPIGFLKSPTLCSNLLKIAPKATLWHFGVLTSAMHMAWMRQVCGRLKSDYRYSTGIVYNNFPWPPSPTDKQRQAVEKAARHVLDVRNRYPDASLADLYDPLTMPADLAKAHRTLDRAVDVCYRKPAFEGERQRIEFLFDLYEQLISPLLAAKPARKQGRRYAP
jgi:hypothetical protein